MDDYSITSLTESKNEWCARLVSLLTHNIIVGINSIFDEAVKLCVQGQEENKYLMTFQNFGTGHFCRLHNLETVIDREIREGSIL